MFEWVRRETLVDVTINALPAVVLAYFVALTVARPGYQSLEVTPFMAHSLTIFPLIVLVVATYVVARAVEADIQGTAKAGVREWLPSPYTPSGAFAWLLVALGVTLVGAVVFLLAFTSATLPW